MKIFKRILLGFVLLLLLAAAVAYFWLRGTLPKTKGDILTSVVERPVEIRRDRWGVPEIRAESDGDLAAAIGFVHAQDRLFQMDLSRRMALGRLSEIFGQRTLEMDIAQKEQLVEEAIAESLAQISPELMLLADRYCQGVNTFIETQRLPPEFRILGYKPEKWRPADMLAIFKNMESILADDGGEMNNMLLVRALGEQAARRLYAGDCGSAIIRPAEAATFFTNQTLNRSWQSERERREEGIGSNNWVVSGSRTETGQPYLANDPHLANRFPSYFYQLRGRSPEMELCGNTLPGIPFVIIGRNRDIGWGFTNIGTDVIDYYLLTINPANPGQYLLDGQWENFQVIRTAITVKNRGQRLHDVQTSHFGPIRREGGLVLAEHSIARTPATVMEAVYGMNRARTNEQFLAALKKFSSPAQNVVFADRLGNIGYFPTGRIPRRGQGDGSLPLPGVRRADLWTGFVSEEEKPFLLNPRRGFIATANNQVLPEKAPLIFSRTTFPAFRADRIEELLSAKEKLSLGDMRAVQTDTLMPNARFLIPRLQAAGGLPTGARSILEQLQKWDRRAAGGPGPFLFTIFERRLAQNIFADHFPDDRSRDLISTSWIYKIMDYPENQPRNEADFESWVDDRRTQQKESFADMVTRSLVQTDREYQRVLAAGGKVDWRSLHTVTYSHPLGSVALLRPFLNQGPYPMAGGRNCIMVASFGGNGFAVNHMSTFRMVIDFADFSRSLMVNSSGQSGNFMSLHYADQIPLYVSARYRTMEEPLPADANPLRLVPAGKK